MGSGFDPESGDNSETYNSTEVDGSGHNNLETSPYNSGHNQLDNVPSIESNISQTDLSDNSQQDLLGQYNYSTGFQGSNHDNYTGNHDNYNSNHDNYSNFQQITENDVTDPADDVISPPLENNSSDSTSYLGNNDGYYGNDIDNHDNDTAKRKLCRQGTLTNDGVPSTTEELDCQPPPPTGGGFTFFNPAQFRFIQFCFIHSKFIQFRFTGYDVTYCKLQVVNHKLHYTRCNIVTLNSV